MCVCSLTVESGGTTIQGEIEWVKPDKQHVTLNGASMGFPGNIEMITIGSDVYMNIGGVWTRQSLPGSGFDASAISDMVASVESLGGDAVKGGTDTVNGKTCQIYTVSGGGGTQEICVADGLPLRVISQVGASKTTIVFTDYNADIEIEAPI